VTTVSNDLSTLTGTAIAGADVDQNFDDVTGAIDDLTASNLNDHAGILSKHITDRYNLVPFGPFSLVSPEGSGTINTPAEEATPNAEATYLEHEVRLGSSRRAYLCIVEAQVLGVTAGGGGEWPLLKVLRNTDVIGGATVQLNAAGKFTMENTNPFANPLIALQDGDDLICKLHEEGAAPTFRGLSVTFWLKIEMHP
tara:strand:- start:184 stop:774 length:591 start_codon:yes stop_codon:yes gene_type:complete